jgi:signal transduction histidine kinase
MMVKGYAKIEWKYFELKYKQGTGLNLAITKNLAEIMGGRIWVQSITGVGATVKVTF